MMLNRLIMAFGLAFALASGACAEPAQNLKDTIYLDTKDGRIVIQLRPDLAPKHVAQIETLTKRGFYDGIVFHRVIDGFMAQTGDPTGTGMGKSDLPNIKAEFSSEPFKRGTVGMARSQIRIRPIRSSSSPSPTHPSSTINIRWSARSSRGWTWSTRSKRAPRRIMAASRPPTRSSRCRWRPTPRRPRNRFTGRGRAPAPVYLAARIGYCNANIEPAGTPASFRREPPFGPRGSQRRSSACRKPATPSPSRRRRAPS